MGEQFAQRHNMKFIETSAKESENVEKIFQEISELLLKQANDMYPSKNTDTKKPSDKPPTYSIGGCCTS